MIFLSVAAMLLASPGALLSSGELPSTAPPPSADELKCTWRGGGPDMREWVVILDDEVIEMNPDEFDQGAGADRRRRVNLDDFGEKSLELFEIVCWRWVEEHYGVQVSAGAIYVLTEDGASQHESGQIAALETIVAAQDRFREAHGRYAPSIEELAGFAGLTEHGLPSYFALDLELTGDGWAARVGATKDEDLRLLAPCRAFVGTVPDGWMKADFDTGPVLQERKPVCS